MNALMSKIGITSPRRILFGLQDAGCNALQTFRTASKEHFDAINSLGVRGKTSRIWEENRASMLANFLN
jgi:hypothetical protein